MRFMALSNFVHGGVLHEATPQQPKIFEFPADEIPSITWRPMDDEAAVALEERADVIEKKTGRRPRVYPVPKELIVPPTPETLEKSKKSDPNALPAATVAALTPKATVGKLEKGKRPSDGEPS